MVFSCALTETVPSSLIEHEGRRLTRIVSNLSPLKRPLYVVGGGGGERKRASSVRFLFFDYCYFIGIPSGSLCGERFRRTTAFLILFISLRKITLLKQRGLCEPGEITEILSIVNVEVFTGCLLLPQGFRPEGEIPRRHSSNSRTYS